MDSTLKRMLGAIFLGAFVGGLVALEVNWKYCSVGIVVGGALSWLIFCYRDIPAAVKRAGNVFENIGTLCSKIAARIRERICESVLAFAAWSYLAALFFGPMLFVADPPEKRSLLRFIIGPLMCGACVGLISMIGCVDPVPRRISQKILRHTNPIALIFYTIKAIVWLVAVGMPLAFTFVKTVFLELHTNEAKLCAIFGCVGSVIGFCTGKLTGIHFGGALTGAVAGVGLAYMDLKYVWPRIRFTLVRPDDRLPTKTEV